ncbi:MAG TPA: prolyl oligopeptidase family serine peptidase [Candidatus Aquilonibacter sp.]|nr:prolyl oligopeptidase family serine peptidase [Candidatus Aquilonibacter sp.]
MNKRYRFAAVAMLCASVMLTQSGALRAQSQSEPQTTVAKAPPPGDPFIWLEDKDGAKAMAWVKEQNAKTLPVLQGDPHYPKLYADALKIAQSQDRIAMPSFIQNDIYNFWQDSSHVRGIWRKATPASYASSTPSWTTVLDVDALAKREKANWVWEGADCNWPAERRCLVSLSDGGEDAQTVREFDLQTKSFVKNGFVLPRGKQTVVWENANTILAARAWSPGDLTTSGYPYVVKELRRGEPLSAAKEIYRGKKSDVFIFPRTLHDGQGDRATLIQRGVTFFTSEQYLLTPSGLKQLNVPAKIDLQGLVDDQLIWTLNQNWTVGGRTLPQGSLIAIDLKAALADPQHLKPTIVYTPGPRESIGGVAPTRDQLLVSIYQNVRGRAFVFSRSASGQWSSKQISLPDNASVGIVDTDLHNGKAFVDVTSFLTPTTLWALDTKTSSARVLKALPAQFDASKDVVEQHEATSKDGTKIPYFIVHPKSIAYDGSNPTVLYAYGGFQISETPNYSGILGKLWLERGGTYVLANIRGGGEFGPAWHDAGLKTHRQRIYDDFYAVAQDLVTRKVTDPRHLGIMGGSNGGLLMGVEFTQHPEEWNAVDIEVPLLDMLRFEKIQAGASWVGEYGSVSVPAQRAFLAKISPYNNLRGGVAYPEPFIWTTTKDDRVGPQHARKFAAKLAAMGVPYLFYEVTEGGHGAGANLKERAHTSALEWTYFTKKLMQ